MPRPRKLRTPDRRWGSWFLKKYGWSLLSRSSDQQQSLPYSHDDMRVAREDYQKLLQSGVHGALILNYDQLWRCCWSHNSRLMFKAGNAGKATPRKAAPARANKKVDAVKHARRGVTALTSSWSDGSAGPIVFCIPEGRMTAAQMHEWNSSHVGSSYVLSSGSRTHFMTADTLLQVFEQVYSPALEKQSKRPAVCAVSDGLLVLAIVCRVHVSLSSWEDHVRSVFGFHVSPYPLAAAAAGMGSTRVVEPLSSVTLGAACSPPVGARICAGATLFSEYMLVVCWYSFVQ